MLAHKWDQPYSTTIWWLRCHLTFSLIRSAIQALRRAISSKAMLSTLQHQLILLSQSLALHLIYKYLYFYFYFFFYLCTYAIKYTRIEEVIKDRTPYIFGRLCSEKQTPTNGTQTLAQTLLYSDSLHEILQSYLLQSESYRRRKSKIGHSHNRTKAFLSKNGLPPFV